LFVCFTILAQHMTGQIIQCYYYYF